MKFSRLSRGRICDCLATLQANLTTALRVNARQSCEHRTAAFSENQLEVCNFVCNLPHGLTPNRTAKRSYDSCETGLTEWSIVQQSSFRAIAGKTVNIKIFLIFLHTVCFMYGLSIFEIKRICHHAQFFIISH